MDNLERKVDNLISMNKQILEMVKAVSRMEARVDSVEKRLSKTERDVLDTQTSVRLGLDTFEKEIKAETSELRRRIESNRYDLHRSMLEIIKSMLLFGLGLGAAIVAGHGIHIKFGNLGHAHRQYKMYRLVPFHGDVYSQTLANKEER